MKLSTVTTAACVGSNYVQNHNHHISLLLVVKMSQQFTTSFHYVFCGVGDVWVNIPESVVWVT